MESALGFIIFFAITLTGIIVPSGKERLTSNFPSGEKISQAKINIPSINTSFMKGIETTTADIEVGELGNPEFDNSLYDKKINKKNKFISPVSNINIRSKFGNRIHPISKKEKFHTGIDLDGEKGDIILATASGRITFVGNKNGYGKTIEISHDNKFQSIYAHLDKINVVIGQRVKSGTEIGKMGKSGNTTGVHLHFEIKKNGKSISPSNVIDF